MRNFRAVEEASNSVDKVILGTVAAEESLLLEELIASFVSRLIVGIDAKGSGCTKWVVKKQV